MTADGAGPDGEALARRQKLIWSLGDYGRVASQLTWVSESLVREVDVRAGQRVLDVAAGTGNAALAAARRCADVTATDFIAGLLDRAEARASVEGLEVRTQVADAQRLPFPEASFDVVLSVLGVSFAPDAEAAARELLRVCCPGGRIGLASWTPDSLVGDMAAVLGLHVPVPEDLRLPVQWGRPERVQELLGPGCVKLRTQRCTAPWRFRSSRAAMEHFRDHYGPVLGAFVLVGEEGREELEDDLITALERRNTATDGTLATEVDYLQVVGVRR